MYTREIQAPVASPIEDGVPIIGTWNRAFEKVNLLEIRKPFPYPLPRWEKNRRIKEWHCFSAQNEDFLLGAIFFNLKLYRAAHIIVYEKKGGRNFLFRKEVPGMGWTLPGSLLNSSIDSHSPKFFFRIHSWLEAGTIRLDINIAQSRQRPSLTAHLAYDTNSHITTPMAVSLELFKKDSQCRRTMYSYKTLAPVHGDINLGGQHIRLKQETCSGFFCDYKGFFPYRIRTTVCSAMGFTNDNRRFGFHIAENYNREPNSNNENALWVNGEFTPLPPVLITMPSGLDGTWVIQDVEGMIDLTFTPKEQNKSRIKLLFANADFNSPMGYYNGMLISRDGEQIHIKNLYGFGEKINLRV